MTWIDCDVAITELGFDVLSEWRTHERRQSRQTWRRRRRSKTVTWHDLKPKNTPLSSTSLVSLSVCVCVCMCVRARVCVYVCVCVLSLIHI